MGKRLNQCDDWEIRVCIHEAGHAVAFRAGGLKVTSIKLERGSFGGLHGGGTVPHGIKNTKDLRNAQIATMAGWRAEALAVHRYYDISRGKALRLTRDGADGDFALFREDADHAGISESKACDKADALVKSKFSEIERIADKLARHGSLGSLWHW